MSILNQLALGFGTSLPVMLQSESTECGLACLAMIAHYHRHHVDLMTLRHRHGISLKGATLADLIRVAQQMDLSARPLKLDLDDLGQLRLPCVLHWNFNHFVVLKAVSAKAVVIHDPATGVRSLSWQEVSRAFTGVALELWPDTHFRPVGPAPAIGLGGLMGRVRGLGGACGQILVLALVLEAFALLSPFFLQWVIDNVLVTADRDLLATLCLGFGLLMLMQQAVTAMRSWTLLYMGTTLNLQWRANIFAHLTRLPVQYFEKRHLGDIVSRFGAIDLIQRTLTISFMEAILDGCMALLTLSMMLLYSPMLGGIAVGAISIYLLGRLAWYGPLRRATDEQLIHAAKQQTHFLETLRGIKTIKLFQRHDQRRNHWLTLLVEQINADLRVQKLQLAYKLLNGVLFGAENVLIIWCGARLVLDGNFSVGVLMAFVAYKNQFANRTSALIDKGFEFKMLQLQGARLADIVLSEPEPAGCAAAVPAADSVPRIAVNAVSFRYSEHDPLVLNEVSFTVGAGECVAIVGPSGCGKTTLLNILLGILMPTSGSIAVDNVDVRHYDPGYLRAVSATVLQDDVLFAGSIADNIHFFAADADQAWVEQCAEVACIADDIRAMPMGFQTLVGDMGSVLSGGQKQRILLARALYKRPKILFLDEATSHLDVQAEQQVNARVKALNITRIIIAHRPETIASAERVITLASACKQNMAFSQDARYLEALRGRNLGA